MKEVTSALRVTLLSAVILVVSGATLMAQTIGEFRSNAPSGGSWSSPATWQTYSASGWVAATSAPTGSEPKITIQSTDSVNVDAAVSITDTLYNLGKINGGSNLTVGSGGVYQHALNGGKIPIATWATGSTCLVTGVTSSAPSNANQNFYNFTWNCPSQSSNVNVGWQSGVNIAGTLTCTSSNWNHSSITSPSSQFRLFGAAGSCTVNNIVVNGRNAVLTMMGSSYADTVTVNGNITLSNGGMLSLSNSSGGVGTYYLKGNLVVVDSANLGKSSSSNLSRIVFSGTTSQSFSHTSSGLINYFSAPIFEVAAGSSLDLDTVTFGGTGSFKVDSGATIAVGLPNGINGNILATGANGGGNSFSTYGSYTYDGAAAQVTGAMLPATVRNLTVNNPAGVSLGKSVNVQGTLTLTSGNLLLDTNYIMAAGVSGASSSSFAVTDSSQSSFKVPDVGATKVFFPVGTTAEGYSPVWITNSGTVDTFSVSAALDSSAAVGGGRVDVKWNIAENNPGGANCALTFGWMAGAQNTTFTATPSLYAQIYNLSGTTFVQAGTGSYSTQLATEPYTLMRSGITTLGSFGVGKFALNVNPLVGDFGSVHSGAWSSLSTWMQWNGTTWGTTPSVVPNGAVNVFINKNDTITVDVADSIGGNMLVDGYLRDTTGLKTAGATVVFDSASTFELAYDGAPKGGSVAGIPTAVWKTGSTCLITGKDGSISSTTGYNANQNFYNLSVNAAFKANLNFGMDGNTINGALTINNTGSSRIYLTSPGSSPKTINVMGNLLLTAGQFSTNGSSSSGDIIVNSYGNIKATGGNFSLSRGSGPVVVWNAYGDSLTLSNATTQTSGTGKFVFAKQGNQYLNLVGVIFGSGGLPVEIDTGAALYMGTSALEGDGSFAADSGSTLACGDTTGVDGNVATSGTVTLSPGASIVFNGAVAQTAGPRLSGTFKNLTVNNSQGVTLSKSVNVSGRLTLTAGALFLDTNTVTAAAVIGGSETSFVSTDSAGSYLEIPGVGNTKTAFPVGTKAEGYSPVWLTNSGTVDSYTVNAAVDTTAAPGGARVKVDWKIGEGTAGGSNLALQLGWTTAAEDTAFARNRSTNSMIYAFTSTDTVKAGTGNFTTQLTYQPYTVATTGVTSVGTFSVGNFVTTGVNDPENVPVVFKLYQNFPNPFNPTTRIEFSVAKKGTASVEVFNILGQHVVTLFSGEAQPGKKYVVDFNGGMFASGVYFSVLQSNGQRQIQKMVLMK